MQKVSFYNQDSPQHQALVASSSNKLSSIHKNRLFPQGDTQISNVILSLSTICRFDAAANTVDYYSYIIDLFTFVRLDLEYYQASQADIVAAIQKEFPKLELDYDTAKATIKYCQLNINNPSFVILQEADYLSLFEEPSFVHAPNQEENGIHKNEEPELEYSQGSSKQPSPISDEEFLESFATDPMKAVAAVTSQIIEQNADLVDPWENDPEHGLVVNKPIYVKGIEGSKAYLASLRTILGEKLTWNRTGSFSIAGINGMIDLYESKTASGVAYKSVYLNMYATDNSTTPPKGFKYINKQS